MYHGIFDLCARCLHVFLRVVLCAPCVLLSTRSSPAGLPAWPIDPTPRPANVIDEDNTAVIVALYRPAVLQCFAVGWKRPSVSWWRADQRLPMSSDQYVMRPDYSLTIQMVTVDELGPYTCQAYNGLGSAASWSVTLQAYRTSAGHDQPADHPYLVVLPRGGHEIVEYGVRVKLTKSPSTDYRTTPSLTDLEMVTQQPHRVFTGKRARVSEAR